jgi:hypothetical protein
MGTEIDLQNRSKWNSLQRLVRSPGFVWSNGISLGLLGALGIYARLFSKGPAFSRLFADPYVNQNFIYLGLLTNLSEVLWCIALAICLFSFGVVRSLRSPRSSDAFFLATAFIIAMLLLDDLQRVTLALTYGLGVPKVITYAAYGLMLLSYAWIFRRHIRRNTPYPLLLITLAFFLVSGLTDLTDARFHFVYAEGPTSMLEDGTKLIGLLNLVLFCWKLGQQEILQAVQGQIRA